MRLLITILLLFNTVNVWVQENSNKAANNRFWGAYSQGIGKLLNKDSNIDKNAGSLKLSLFFSKQKSIFRLNYRSTHNINGFCWAQCPALDYINEINFQYGYNFNKKKYAFNALVGIGVGFGERRVYKGETIPYNYNPLITYSTHKFDSFIALNFPIDANFIWIIRPKFGITINTFTFLNKDLIGFGGTIGLTFGRLR